MAQRIESRMEGLGIPNPAQLAKKADISRAVLTNIMRRPDKQLWVNVAIKLANALECRVEWMVQGTGPINDDVTQASERLYGQSPLVELNELAEPDLGSYVSSCFKDTSRLVYHCPIPTSENTVSIKIGRDLGRFDSDTVFFVDLNNHLPRSGQIVLARPTGGGTPEFYTYSTSMNKQFIKSMSKDLPEDLQFMQVDKEIEFIGCFVAAIIV